MEKPDIKIFVVCHKNVYVPKHSMLIPIQAGAVLTDDKFADMQLDCTGINISEKNKSFCELTAYYWAWKNTCADYVGFFQYKRYLSFNEEEFETDDLGNIICEDLSENTLRKLNLNPDILKAVIPQYDCITVKKRDINAKRKEIKLNNYEEYAESNIRFSKDLDAALHIAAQKYPDYIPSIYTYMQDTNAYEHNMCIMKSNVFDAYCEWLFDILFTLEQECDFSEYNEDESRVIEYIAERLFGIYYTHLKLDKDKCLLEVQRALIEDVDRNENVSKISEHHIPIVVAANNRFTPYLSTMLQSMMDNANKKRKYDIIVLHRDIVEENVSNIKEQIKTFGNGTIRFVNIKKYFDKISLFIDQHLSEETYFRLVIPELMPEYKKILYLDSDIIVKRDISQLYDFDLKDNVVAAVRDIDIAGQVKIRTDVAEYVENQLRLKNKFDYFQAGVMVVDLESLRKIINTEDLLKLASGFQWRCHDQDVLNYVCNGHVIYLPQAWNVLMNWSEGDRSRLEILKQAPLNLYEEYLKARKDPLIVHFAGYQKPWDKPQCDFAWLFWYYARRTPYYESMIERIVLVAARKDTESICDGKNEELKKYLELYLNKHNSGEEFAAKLAAAVDKLLPLHSKRREAVKHFIRIFIR